MQILEINSADEFLSAHAKHEVAFTRLEDENVYGIPTGDIDDHFTPFDMCGVLANIENDNCALLAWYEMDGNITINTLGSTGGGLGKHLVNHLCGMFPLSTINVLTGESPRLFGYYSKLGFIVADDNFMEPGVDGYVQMVKWQ